MAHRIVLNRPAKLNAMDLDTRRGFSDVSKRLRVGRMLGRWLLGARGRPLALALTRRI